MMAQYRTRITSPKNAEQVFDYMAKFSNVKEWDPTVVKAEMIGDGEIRIGTRFHVLVRWLGREIPLEYTIMEYQRPGRVVLRAENSTTVTEDTITVEAVGEGCELTYQVQLKLKGAMKLFAPLFGLALKRLGDNAAAGLRRELLS
jgi:carbon monoxide dehydrogenase subunit G